MLEEHRQVLLLREATPERSCEGRLTWTRESEERSLVPKHWSADGRGQATLRQLWGKARGAGCHQRASKPQKQSPEERDVLTRARLLLGAPGPTQASCRKGAAHTPGSTAWQRVSTWWVPAAPASPEPSLWRVESLWSFRSRPAWGVHCGPVPTQPTPTHTATCPGRTGDPRTAGETWTWLCCLQATLLRPEAGSCLTGQPQYHPQGQAERTPHIPQQPCPQLGHTGHWHETQLPSSPFSSPPCNRAFLQEEGRRAPEPQPHRTMGHRNRGSGWSWELTGRCTGMGTSTSTRVSQLRPGVGGGRGGAQPGPCWARAPAVLRVVAPGQAASPHTAGMAGPLAPCVLVQSTRG